MRLSSCILCLLALWSGCGTSSENGDRQAASPPNIIYILADDLGYGDLGCYGQQNFQTPNIDRLAADGMRFTQHYAGSAVCAPSRSTLMTGLHTGHTPIRGNRELEGEGQTPLPAEAFTIAELLKNAGYRTGAFGKWGLGFVGTEGDPLHQGFDEFYGYNCQRMAHRYYPPYLWHNDEKVEMPGNDWIETVTYAPDEIQTATLSFIEENKDRPFFAYVPMLQPHAELMVPEDELLQQYQGHFEEVPHEAPHPYLSDYGPDMESQKYSSQAMPFAVYAAMVARLDRYVGEIREKLEALGLAENTIIMFSSDNGPHREGGANPDYFQSAGGLRGVKRDLYEGGIRTPFIVNWPGHIEPGSVTDHVSAFWDVLPTVAEITGSSLPLATDGISFLPTLLGKAGQTEHPYLYWEFGNKGGRQAVRMGKWKGVVYNLQKQGPDPAIELYDLDTDVAESHNLAGEHPEIVQEMKEILGAAHTPSELFPLK